MKKWKTLIFLLAGSILVLLPFAPVILDSHWIFLFRDLSQIILPVKAAWVSAIETIGRVPQWNPYNLGGTPFLASSNPGPLYPLNWVLYFLRSLGMGRALVFFLILNHLLIFLGGFLLMRSFRVRDAFAILGALALAIGGIPMSSDNVQQKLCAQVGIVFFLFFWRRALRRRAAGLFILLAALALAWPIYSSDPQFTYLGSMLALLIACQTREHWLSLRKWLALEVACFLAAAPQLLPTYFFTKESTRGFASLPIQELQAWSLHPLRWIELLVPLPFGSMPDPTRFWGEGLVAPTPQTSFLLFSIYPGLFTTFCGLLWLGLRAAKPRYSLRRLWLWPWVLFLLFWASLGSLSPIPVFSLLCKWVPLWSAFRYPEKLGYWIILSWIIFGTISLERVWRLKRISKRKIAFLPLAFVLVPVVLSFGLWFYLAGKSFGPFAHSLLIFAGLLFALWVLNQPKREKTALNFLVFFALLDLLLTASQVVWPQSVSIASEDRLIWVQKIHEDLQKNFGQLNRGGARRFYWRRGGALSGRHYPENSTEFDKDTIYYWTVGEPNTPLYWQIEDIRGYSALPPKRTDEFWALFAATPELQERMLDLMSVRYQLHLFNREPIVSLRPQALPYVIFPQSIENNSENEIRKRLIDPAWDHHKTVLIEGPPIPASAAVWELKQLEKKWDEIHMQLESRADGASRFLLLNEGYHPHWRALLSNGKELPIFRANGWAMAVELPETRLGEKLFLEMRFRDPWYERGQLLFGVWLISFLFLSIRELRAIKRVHFFQKA